MQTQHLALVACPIALAAPALSAQMSIVVPSGFTATDSPGLGDVPGVMQSFRQQVLIDASELTAASQRELIAIALRREGRDQRAFAGGRANLTVRISIAPHGPHEAATTFSANHGAVTIAYQGAIDIPASPALSGPHAATWSAPHAIVIPLAPTFRYVAGTLCVDIEGNTIAGQSPDWWPTDAYTSLSNGTVTTIGSRCAPHGTASASAASLTPGSTVRLVATGQAASAGFMLLGSRRLSSPIDLAILGAPACFVHTLPGVLLPAMFSAPGAQDLPGVAEFALHLPPLTNLLSSEVIVQWLNLQRTPTNPAGITTTNALGLRLASAWSPLPVATVRSGLNAPGVPMPDTGRVQQGRTPVMQLTFR